MRDIDIREALRAEIARRHNGESNTLVVEELGLCQGIARVDLAVVNGSVNGYEIKSAHDTLSRLPAQSDVYSRPTHTVHRAGGRMHWPGLAQQRASCLSRSKQRKI